MIVVPRVNTPFTMSEAAPLLASAFSSVFGRALTDTSRASLLALIAIETGHGKSSNNHNVGNISASQSFSGTVWRPPWFDFDGGTNDTPKNRELHEAMLAGRAPSAFRSYESLDAGMLDFVSKLKSNFPEVISASETADPDAFRVALAKKYSPDYANPRATETFASLFREFGLDPKAGAGVGESSPSPGSVALPTLRRGFYGPAVSLLSRLLGTPTEIFDGELIAAVRTFQRSYGLAPDGVCGPKTWHALISKTRAIGLAGTT